MSNSSIERLLTTEEVAEILGISPDTIAQQRWKNQKPGALGFRVGNRVLYRSAALEEWIDECEAAERRSQAARGRE